MGYGNSIRPTTRFTVPDQEAVLVVAGVLAEAGYAEHWYSPGGNEVVVTDEALAALNDEQRGEVAKLSGGAIPTGAPAKAGSDAGDEPPRSGAGSGRDAWAAYATSKGINVPADAGRDQIIELVEAQR